MNLNLIKQKYILWDTHTPTNCTWQTSSIWLKIMLSSMCRYYATLVSFWTKCYFSHSSFFIALFRHTCLWQAWVHIIPSYIAWVQIRVGLVGACVIHVHISVTVSMRQTSPDAQKNLIRLLIYTALWLSWLEAFEEIANTNIQFFFQ